MAEKMLRDKLGYKPGQTVLLLDLQDGISDPFEGVDHTVAQAKTAKLGRQKFEMVLAFTRDQAALATVARVAITALVEDAKLWLAYPKKTGKISTDLTRDAGWTPLFDAGYIVVSIVSLNETWSAVRFRARHLVKSSRC